MTIDKPQGNLSKGLIEELMQHYQNPEDILGKNGLLKQLTKALLERAMEGELRFPPMFGQ